MKRYETRQRKRTKDKTQCVASPLSASQTQNNEDKEKKNKIQKKTTRFLLSPPISPQFPLSFTKMPSLPPMTDPVSGSNGSPSPFFLFKRRVKVMTVGVPFGLVPVAVTAHESFLQRPLLQVADEVAVAAATA